MTIAAKERIPRLQASLVAHELIELLSDTCERIEIAGSIRRKSETVKDIELVCVPELSTVRTDLFGDVVEVSNELDVLCVMFRAHGKLTDRLDKNGRPAWGTRYKRAMYEGVPVDLFSVLPPAQLGVIMAIRTGPWLFSQSIVTQKFKGGVLPDQFFVSDGALWVKHWGDDPTIVPTPTEEDFFTAIGMPWIAPEDRR